MRKRVCLITGASSGIGKATAMGLAGMGATVVLVCRDRDRGESARREIARVSGGESVELLVADLSSQQAVRRAAKELVERHRELHVLVNNAGVALNRRSLTDDGIELTLALNYLAPFLLTNLLLGALRAASPSRVVNVSSDAQAVGRIDLDDLQGEKRFSIIRAYSQSKLAVVLFTYELARRLAGTGVTVNCLHPGHVDTAMNRKVTGFIGFLGRLVAPLSLHPEKGARTSLYLASSPEVEQVTGAYFVKCRPARSARASYDVDLARRLWRKAEELTGLA